MGSLQETPVYHGPIDAINVGELEGRQRPIDAIEVTIKNGGVSDAIASQPPGVPVHRGPGGPLINAINTPPIKNGGKTDAIVMKPVTSAHMPPGAGATIDPWADPLEQSEGGVDASIEDTLPPDDGSPLGGFLSGVDNQNQAHNATDFSNLGTVQQEQGIYENTRQQIQQAQGIVNNAGHEITGSKPAPTPEASVWGSAIEQAISQGAQGIGSGAGSSAGSHVGDGGGSSGGESAHSGSSASTQSVIPPPAPPSDPKPKPKPPKKKPHKKPHDHHHGGGDGGGGGGGGGGCA